jgi:hypothetical protein
MHINYNAACVYTSSNLPADVLINTIEFRYNTLDFQSDIDIQLLEMNAGKIDTETSILNPSSLVTTTPKLQ